jgi:hypothetical protein
LLTYNFIIWFGFAVNFGISTAYGPLLYFGAPVLVVNLVLPVLYIATFTFLANGLYRIRKVMKTLTDKIVIFEAFLLHAITCALFWVGQIPNLIFAILNASGSY